MRPTALRVHDRVDALRALEQANAAGDVVECCGRAGRHFASIATMKVWHSPRSECRNCFSIRCLLSLRTYKLTTPQVNLRTSGITKHTPRPYASPAFTPIPPRPIDHLSRKPESPSRTAPTPSPQPALNRAAPILPSTHVPNRCNFQFPRHFQQTYRSEKPTKTQLL